MNKVSSCIIIFIMIITIDGRIVVIMMRIVNLVIIIIIISTTTDSCRTFDGITKANKKRSCCTLKEITEQFNLSPSSSSYEKIKNRIKFPKDKKKKMQKDNGLAITITDHHW